MKAIPSVKQFMTPHPHTISKDADIQEALALMAQHRIRHLPVRDEGGLVGILSERNARVGAAYSDTTPIRVGDVMTPEPFVVRPDTPLDQVLIPMTELKYGSAIVQEKNGEVVGIFTAIDALEVLVYALRESCWPSLLERYLGARDELVPCSPTQERKAIRA